MSGILFTFALTSLLIELTPGPNMVYLAVLSVKQGRRAGLAAVTGVALGLGLLGLIAGVGAGTLVSENRYVYETLCWGGVLYLLWLAWDSWRDARLPAPEQAVETGLLRHFRRGLITNLLNPKAAIFFVAVLPGFVLGETSVGVQTVTLSATYVAVATGVHVSIVLAASTLQAFLGAPAMRKIAGAIFAALLVVAAVWFALSTQRACST